MKNSIAIELLYKQCSIPLINLDELKKELSKEYIFQARSYWAPAAGGNFDAIANLIFNTSLQDFIYNVIICGLAWDLLKIGTEQFFIKPFITFIEYFLKSNKSFEYTGTNLQFNDININIIGRPNDLHKTLGKIIEFIVQRQDILFNSSNLELYEITIPLIKDAENNRFFTPYNNNDFDNYFYYWGLKYKGLINYVLDLHTNEVIKDAWI